MDSQHLKTEKLIPVDLPEICAPRLELLEAFDKAAVRRCVYVGAPAGCGKTVSTLLWLKKAGRKTIWLGLDKYDNTLAGFYRLFCTAFIAVIPQEEHLMEIVRNPAFSASPVEYTIEVLAQLAFENCEYALVFDDFHLITDEEIVKSLLYVVKRLPLSVTVFILSRDGLPAALTPLEEGGKIALLGPSDLAFTSKEIRRHFASFGRFITSGEAEEALRLTGGWAIAVGALVLSGHIPADEKLKNNPLWKYIKTQIWDKMEEEHRLFMLRTSVPDKLSVRLCELLTRDARSRGLLDELLSTNMFLFRQEDEYRYHHLFLAFLREEAEREIPPELPSLYRKTAEYYSDAGDHFNALRYSIKCADRTGIAGAIHRYMRFSGQSSSDMAKIYFINELPADFLEQNPVLYVSCAYCALIFSEARRLYFFLDRIYERLNEVVGESGVFFGAVLFLLTVDPRYSYTEQLARLQTVPPPAADDLYIPKTLTHNMPFMHKTFQDHSHYALNTEEHFAEFRAMFFSILGGYYPVVETGIRAGLLYEKDLLREAFEAVRHDPDTDSGELVFSYRMLKASCLYAMGRTDEAARCREDLKAFLKSGGPFYLMPVFSAYETKLKLLDGARMTARTWLENYFVTEESRPELNRVFIHFTTVRAYIVLGEFEKARRLCQMLITFTSDFHRLLDNVEARILFSIILWMAGEKQEAARLLHSALADTEPYGFIRVFADEGKAILPLLKRLVKKTEQENPAGRPGGRYLKEVYLAAYEQAGRFKGIACAAELKPVKLSRQQKRVLELLAKGYKNAQIVELTGLSINTVRSHTKATYQKLGVGNAADAVLKARERKLID
jgi:LuxR family maltose regulon positive regulatory protein